MARRRIAEDESPDARRMMSDVARAYYFGGASKSDIARDTGLSRFRVARLLDAARECGIVRISLDSGMPRPELSEALRAHLDLSRAYVIDAYGDEGSLRASVASATGVLLSNTLRAGEVLGLGWGRTLNGMMAELDSLPPVEVVALSGRFGADVRDDAAALARRAEELSGSETRSIPAPFFMDDAHKVDVARRHRAVAAVMGQFRRLTTAVVAVGALYPRFISIAYTGVPVRFAEQVRSSGAVGEICGNLFAPDGHVIDNRLSGHSLTISAEQLRGVPRVIAAAGHPVKAEAVHSVCMSRVITELVVDVALAQALLGMEPIGHSED